MTVISFPVLLRTEWVSTIKHPLRMIATETNDKNIRYSLLMAMFVEACCAVQENMGRFP
jgi:hypothetical protein